MGSGHLLDLHEDMGKCSSSLLEAALQCLPGLPGYGPHFTDVETEARRGYIHGSSSPRQEGRGRRLESRRTEVGSQALSKTSAGPPGITSWPPDGCKNLFLTLAEPSEERERSWQMSPNPGMISLTPQKIPEHRVPANRHEVAPIGLSVGRKGGTHGCGSARCP